MRRVLIDECINPRLASRLAGLLPQCSVQTVKELGWSGRKDHLLVRAIDESFDVFVTVDKGFEFEHNLKVLSFGIIVVTSANNQMPSYERLLRELVERILTANPGQIAHVADPAC
jgi:hypothetical protein